MHDWKRGGRGGAVFWSLLTAALLALSMPIQARSPEAAPGKRAVVAAKPAVKAKRAAAVAKPVAKAGSKVGKATRVVAAPVAAPARGARTAAAAGRSSARGPGLRVGRARGAALRLAVLPPSPPPLAVPSMGQVYGLHATDDALDLRSSVALVVDQDTDEVLFSKNARAVLPIASLTKLMTALVVTEARLPLEEVLTVDQADVEATAGNRSRLRLGTQLSRGDMLHLALMSSENRAAQVLGRSYPGGLDRFVEAMNLKARALGMADTRYVEPTGLSSANQSSARDLTRLVKAASVHPIIRELSTSRDAVVPVGDHAVQFRNTNRLVGDPDWDIGLQKTGYIAAAGRCMVVQAQLAGRKLIMVLLDSAGKYSRIGDAERIRRYVVGPQSSTPLAVGTTASQLR